jgi:hypothetical protein
MPAKPNYFQTLSETISANKTQWKIPGPCMTGLRGGTQQQSATPVLHQFKNLINMILINMILIKMIFRKFTHDNIHKFVMTWGRPTNS